VTSSWCFILQLQLHELIQRQNILIAGHGTAERAASSVAMQLRRRPLYGEHSGSRKFSLCKPVIYNVISHTRR